MLRDLRDETVKRLFLFLILTFFFSWSLWIFAIFQGTSTAFLLTHILYLAGVFGPSIAGVVLVLYFYTPSEKRIFIRRIFTIRHDGRLFVAIAIIIIPTLVFLARYMSGLLGLGNPSAILADLYAASPWNIFRVLFFTLLLGPVSEELGWRGFFTDSLIKKHDFFATAALTGLVWGFWHIPLFLIPGSGQNAMGIFTLGFWVFFTTPVVFSFLILILYIATGGSLAAAILVHFSVNISLVAFPLNSAGYGIFTTFLVLFVLMLHRAAGLPKIRHRSSVT